MKLIETILDPYPEAIFNMLLIPDLFFRMDAPINIENYI